MNLLRGRFGYAVMASAIAGVVVLLANRYSNTSRSIDAVGLIVLGFTNAGPSMPMIIGPTDAGTYEVRLFPKSTGYVPLALICVSNRAPYSVFFHCHWVELERLPGDPNSVNAAMPPMSPDGIPYDCKMRGSRYPSVLRPRASIQLVIEEPIDRLLFEDHRWRLAMRYSRYTRDEWLMTLADRQGWPLQVGPIVLADPIRIIRNGVTVTTRWINPEYF